jgi:hypothetical protein
LPSKSKQKHQRIEKLAIFQCPTTLSIKMATRNVPITRVSANVDINTFFSTIFPTIESIHATLDNETEWSDTWDKWKKGGLGSITKMSKTKISKLIQGNGKKVVKTPQSIIRSACSQIPLIEELYKIEYSKIDTDKFTFELRDLTQEIENKKIETNKWHQVPGNYIAPKATNIESNDDEETNQSPTHFGFLEQLSNTSDELQKLSQQSDDLISFSASSNSEKKTQSYTLKETLKTANSNMGNIIYPPMDQK